MLSMKELKEWLEKIEHYLLTGCDFTDRIFIHNYSDYKYYIGKREVLIDMLKPKKREPKEEVPTRKLQEFGLENPVKRKDEPHKK